MPTPRAVIAFALIFVGLAAAPVVAQDESALKSFFEGRRVTVRIDMPGTSDGVDVFPTRGGEIDLQDYRNNLRRYGSSIHAGDSVVVTLVKVKKDLIEFQLAGGGFGTFWDDTSTSVTIPLVEKSAREKELEKRIKDEDDSRERRRMQRELDDLRDRRERENHRIRVERERESARKAERVAEERLRGGSRFNVRYERVVPADVTPGQVMTALAEYVDFGMSPRLTDARDEVPPPPADITALRKGMTRDEAERVFGPPSETSERHEGSLTITTAVFFAADQRVAAEFVDDVLVRYAITPK